MDVGLIAEICQRMRISIVETRSELAPESITDADAGAEIFHRLELYSDFRAALDEQQAMIGRLRRHVKCRAAIIEPAKDRPVLDEFVSDRRAKIGQEVILRLAVA